MNSRKEVKSLIFHNYKQAWVPAKFSSKDTSITGIDAFSFLTYNIWHDQSNFEERSTELLKIIQESSADFVCLQEVTEPFLEKLKESKWVQDEYYIPDIPITKDTTLILSKMPCWFYTKEIPTRMNRFLLYAEVEVNGTPIAVANVHLESFANGQCRKSQLDATFSELSSYPKVFILGDFNFDWITENKYIASNYVDIWPLLRPNAPGYTMPKTHDFIAWRPDRVLVKMNTKYKPISIRRVGMEPLPKFQEDELSLENVDEPDEHAIRTPSDHFGLLFSMEMLDYTKEEWKIAGQRGREKAYRPKKRGNYVWIDGMRKGNGNETATHYEDLERAVAGEKGNLRGFEKVDDGLEDTISKLDYYDDLTLILTGFSLHEILNSWKKELKVIQDKYVHEKHFRFKIVVFTTRQNFQNAKQLCIGAGFEKYLVVTQFGDVVNSLTAEA